MGAAPVPSSDGRSARLARRWWPSHAGPPSAAWRLPICDDELARREWADTVAATALDDLER
jgi:hypothetical protein